MGIQTPEVLAVLDSLGKVRQGLKAIENSYNIIEALLLEFVEVLKEPVEQITAPSLDVDLQLQSGLCKMEGNALNLVSDTGRVNFQVGFLEILIPVTGIFVEKILIQFGKSYDYRFSTGITSWEWHLLIFWSKMELRLVLLKWTDWKRRKKK